MNSKTWNTQKDGLVRLMKIIKVYSSPHTLKLVFKESIKFGANKEVLREPTSIR